MGCRIIVGKEDGGNGCDVACLYCSTTGIVFGPTFDGEYDPSGNRDAHDEAEAFIRFMETMPAVVINVNGRNRRSNDPRSYDVADLMRYYERFCRLVEAGKVPGGETPDADELAAIDAGD